MSPLWSLLGETAKLAIAAEARRTVRRTVAAVVTYAAVGVLGLAALVFLYVLLYRLLADSVGPKPAAAIMVGGNLLLIGLILAGRAIFANSGGLPARPRPSNDTVEPPLNLSEASLEAGIALGARIGDTLRKSTPTVVLIAGIAGLVIGLRPQLLGLFGRKGPSSRKR